MSQFEICVSVIYLYYNKLDRQNIRNNVLLNNKTAVYGYFPNKRLLVEYAHTNIYYPICACLISNICLRNYIEKQINNTIEKLQFECSMRKKRY